MQRNCYEILGASPDDSADTITETWRAVLVRYDPEKFADLDEEVQEQITRRVKEADIAYEILRDPDRRTAYDEKLQAERSDAQRITDTDKPQTEEDEDDQVDATDNETIVALKSFAQRANLRKNLWWPIKFLVTTAAIGLIASGLTDIGETVFGQDQVHHSGNWFFSIIDGLGAAGIMGAFLGVWMLLCGCVLILMELGGQLRDAAYVIRTLVAVAIFLTVMISVTETIQINSIFSIHIVYRKDWAHDRSHTGLLKDVAIAISVFAAQVAISPDWLIFGWPPFWVRIMRKFARSDR